MSGSWECAGVKVKWEMPVLLFSFPLPVFFFWRPEHSLVMEDVSVAHDLSFKPGLGGEGKSIWNLKKLSKLL